MTLPLLLISFALGASVGSFVNAWTYRLRHNLPVIKDRSICPSCKTQIKSRDLIPLLSFFKLGGKCRSCDKKISIQYPLVELATGILFAASFYQYFGSGFVFPTLLNSFSFLSQLYFITILMALLLYDLKHMELPDKVVIPGLVTAFIVSAVKITLGVLEFRDNTLRLPIGRELMADSSFVLSHIWEIASPLVYGALAGLFLAVIFYVIVLLSRERAMGGGDIKLALLLGLILPWPYLVPAMYIGFILGAVTGIMLVVINRKKMKQLIPLAPFLVVGTISAIFFGNELFRLLLSVKFF